MGYARWLLLLVLVYLLLATYYNVAQPIWEAPEEPANVELVRYIQINHQLPRSRPDAVAATPPSPPGQEFVQVPLYYLVLAVALQSIELPPGATWHRNPYVAWPDHPWRFAVAYHRADEGWPYRGLSLLVHLGRLLSTAFGLLGILATFGLMWTITNRPGDALFGAAWLALTPVVLLQSSRVSNDTAVLAFSTLTLWLTARVLVGPTHPSIGALLVLSVTLAAALLSKAHAVFLVPTVGSALLVETWQRDRKGWWLGRGLARVGLVVLGPLALLALWWWEYGRYFGSFLGEQMGASIVRVWDVLGHADWARLPGAIWLLNATWWGTAQFDELIRWPSAVYVGAAIPALTLTLLGLSTLCGPSFWTASPDHARCAVVLLLLGATLLLSAVLARTVTPWIGYSAQARFLLPAAPVLALVVALGRRRLPRPIAMLGSIVPLGGLAALAIATPLVLFPRINAPTIPARLARSSAELEQPAIADYANGVRLLAVDGLDDDLAPGRARPLVLHWLARQPPGEDFTVSTQLITWAGERVSGRDLIPFENVFPPRQWEPGELVDLPTSLPVPPDLPAGAYALRIVLYHRLSGEIKPIPPLVPTDDGAARLGTWRVLPPLSDLSSFRRVSAQFGDELTLVGYRLTRSAPGLVASLLWEPRVVVSRHLVVSVQALDRSGKLVAQHDGEPVEGRLPTPTWRPGDRIRDDHVVPLPTDATFARVIVVAYDRQTTQRLTVVAPEQELRDYFDVSDQ